MVNSLKWLKIIFVSKAFFGNDISAQKDSLKVKQKLLQHLHTPNKLLYSQTFITNQTNLPKTNNETQNSRHFQHKRG